MDKEALLAKCDELLVFLADHDNHRKLRRLTEDIRQLRERLLRDAAADSGSRHPQHDP